MPSIARISRAFLLEILMDNKQRIYKLIEELQDKLAGDWRVESLSVQRAVSDGKKVLLVEIELAE